jgi:hypothetical protein
MRMQRLVIGGDTRRDILRSPVHKQNA